MNTLTVVLVALASIRTWRLITIDGAGAIVRKIVDDALWKLNPREARGQFGLRRKYASSEWAWKRHKLAMSLSKGFYCSFCSGFWITLAWTGSALAWSDSWVWQLTAMSFAASYVVGHLGAIMDAKDADHDD